MESTISYQSSEPSIMSDLTKTGEERNSLLNEKEQLQKELHSNAELIQQLVVLLKDKLTDGTIAEALDIAAEIEEDQMYGHGGEGGIMMEKQQNEEKLEHLQAQENTIQSLQKEAIAKSETENCQQTHAGQNEPKCFTDLCKEMIAEMVESF